VRSKNKKKISSALEKRPCLPYTYIAGVVTVHSKVIGLAPGDSRAIDGWMGKKHSKLFFCNGREQML
jgi:phosphoribosylformylglycinamidine (FGAM) synthase-like amidotransferase family enzyme